MISQREIKKRERVMRRERERTPNQESKRDEMSDRRSLKNGIDSPMIYRECNEIESVVCLG